MKGTFTISVARYDPEVDTAPRFESYDVPAEAGMTVMAALLYVYEQHDSTLGFRYACRNEYCGLCAVDVDGKPRLACVTPLKSGMRVGPLRTLPVARDLTVDRQWLLPFLSRFDLFVPPDDAAVWPRRLTIPEEYARLASCTECLSCLAACPSYEHGRADLGGPLHFVKLAQLHWHPRNTVNRRSQAAELGIARCADCRKCACPIGIPIYRMAVAPLAGGGAAPPRRMSRDGKLPPPGR